MRSACGESPVVFTWLLGIATLVALSVGRVGASPAAIATYYRGGESEMSFPKTFWQIMEVNHFHLFTVPSSF